RLEMLSRCCVLRHLVAPFGSIRLHPSNRARLKSRWDAAVYFLRSERKGDPERRALAGLGAGGDLAAVRLRDRGDDRKAEPDAAARARTRLVGAVEALEDPLRLLRRHPPARVLHLDQPRAVGGSSEA